MTRKALLAKYRRSNTRCVYCGVICLLLHNPTGYLWYRLATLDHVFPRSKQGNGHRSSGSPNKVLCCRQCNLRKRNMHWMKFVATEFGLKRVKIVKQKLINRGISC